MPNHEHLSAFAAVIPGAAPGLLNFTVPESDQPTFGGSGVLYAVQPDFTETDKGFLANPVSFYARDRPVRIYYEGCTTPKVSIGAIHGFGQLFTRVTIYVYLIDASNQRSLRSPVTYPERLARCTTRR